MECIKASATRYSGSNDWDSGIRYSTPSSKPYTQAPRLTFIHHHAPRSSSRYSNRSSSNLYPAGPLLGHSCRRTCMKSISLDKESSLLLERDHISDFGEEGECEERIKALRSDELKSLLADAERAKLIRKLSDANQYNRFLKRQLQLRDDALATFKTNLAVLELELQALVGLADEVATSRTQFGSKKIQGKYIQSHLFSKLKGVHEKLKEQIIGVDSLKFQEVVVNWVGMAECVQVMGSFDGWSKGEEASPEYTGYCTRFSATLKLRPGRYEIKFLVDGEWKLSPEFPIVGEGMMKNNLLIVA